MQGRMRGVSCLSREKDETAENMGGRLTSRLLTTHMC